MNNTRIFKDRPTPTTETSDFYYACSINDIPRVKSHLARMTVNEINKFEPNGSTALHTACYHENAGVVYLLIKRGALGSIKNNYGLGLTPYEETTSRHIKQLLLSTGNAAWIEWTFTDPPTRETKQIFDSALANTFHTMGLPFILEYLLNHYARRHVAEELPTFIQEIEWYFLDARRSISLFPIITLYTTTTNFDKIMNKHCIDVLPNLLRINTNPDDTLTASIFYLIASFNFDPMLRPKYAYTGRVYRGLITSLDYIRTYRKDELVVNRPFLSTSKSIEVANAFAGIEERNQFRKTRSSDTFLQVSVRCTYEIRRPETRAIDITNMSVLPENEQEILLMPLSVFRVVDIESDVNESAFYIILEDCDLPSKHDPLAPTIRCDFAEIPSIPLIIPIIQPLSNPPTNITNPFFMNSADWRRRLAEAIVNISTQGVVSLIIIISIVVILILLAILLPILLRPSCNIAT